MTNFKPRIAVLIPYYHAASAPVIVARLFGESLMVVGRHVTDEAAAYRQDHRLGNWLLTECVARVFSRRFVKSFPALATGFVIVAGISHLLVSGVGANPYLARVI